MGIVGSTAIGIGSRGSPEVELELAEVVRAQTQMAQIPSESLATATRETVIGKGAELREVIEEESAAVDNLRIAAVSGIDIKYSDGGDGGGDGSDSEAGN